jgi:hypothetical protein
LPLGLVQDPFECALINAVAVLGKLPALNESSLLTIDGLKVTIEQVGACLQREPMGSVEAWVLRYRVWGWETVQTVPV